MLRSAVYVLGLARRRLGRRTGVTLLVPLGIAAGAALLFGVRVATTVAQDRAVSQSIERIPDGSRALRAVWFGVPGLSGEPQPALDARVRHAVAQIDLDPPTALVLFRESTLAGTFAGLGGIDGISGWVTLRSGRIPRECRPARCEVLRLRGSGRLPQPAGLRLVEVGEASLPSRILMGDFLAPTDNALADAEVSPALAQAAGYHRPPPPPLFLAEGVRALAAAPALARIYRSYAWVSPLRSGRPRLWEVDELAEGVTSARSELQAHTTSFDVIAPVEELRDAQATTSRAGHRLALVGGEAAALLFAFAILAAATRRRDVQAAARRLAWYGGRAWQIALLTGVEAVVLAAAGTALGFGVGTVVGVLVAREAGAPPGAVLGQSVLSFEGLLLAIAIVGAAAGILAATAAAQARSERVPVSILDVAAAVALAVVLFAVALGAEGDVVLLLPALATFGAAVLVARLLRPGLRLLERAARTRSLGLRLASLSLSRNPGQAVVATAFLVVSFGLALFAESYRATLAQGEHDQAAFAVPRDYLVREDLTRLIPVLDAAPLERFRALPDADVSPVLRLRGGVGRLEGESGITVLGLPPEALSELEGWRDDFADRSPQDLAAVIDRTDVPVGTRLPTGLDELVARIEGGRNVHVAAQVETPRGRFARIDLEPAGVGLLRGPVPAAARGGRLVALELEPVSRLQERGADAGQAATGSVRLTFVALPNALDGWIGVGGASPRDGAIHYTLTNVERTRLRPPQRSDTEPVPVLATSRLARAADENGLLPLQVGGERIPVRVAGRVDRFPGMDGPGVVGDVDALVAALNAQRPGSARVGEVWIGLDRPAAADAVAAALAAPPFDVLQVASRRALEAEAREDPIAHGTLLTLLVAALVALGLALAGVLLTVLGDLRDERGEFFDLESQGAGPAVLRRVVRLRAFLVAAAGLLAGAVTGLALGALVTDLVSLTARASDAEPPLRLEVEPAVVAGAVALYALLATGLVVVATRRAFPVGGVPRRAESPE